MRLSRSTRNGIEPAQAALRDVEALVASNQAQRADLERLPQRVLAQAFEN